MNKPSKISDSPEALDKVRLSEKPIPHSRVARFAKLGGLVASVTGNVVKNSLTSMTQKQTPNINNTLFHTNNAQAITKHLSHMRGAAMKIGQMLSMDAGELLPNEWEPILSLLRENAYSMPKSQLIEMMVRNFGQNWTEHFERFSFEPIAAASIGQVHKAKLKSGEDVAIKVQYPGVAKSIDSDVDNLVSIIKLSRLVPQGFDLDDLMRQAKLQLKLETDYIVELGYLSRYREYFKNDPRFLIPTAYEHLTTKEILCMEFIDAKPIACLAEESTKLKQEMVGSLFDVLFKELFDFGLVQSDPNFANYMYQKSTNKLVLLDFGACKEISKDTQNGFRKMARAMQTQDEQAIHSSLLGLGLLDTQSPDHVKKIVISACLMAGESLQTEKYNFKQAEIIKRLQQLTQGLITEKNATASPDFEVALVHRKVMGTVLLANKMQTSTPLRGLLNYYI